ncbi:nuclear transport factor 2 family protein [Parapedomonas caeni]|jgi:ketosteroid isomerase-like protein
MSYSGPIEDRLAIRELLETYADAVCRVDAEAWGACWAEDSVWSMPDYPQFGEVKGKAAIVAMWIEAMKHYPGIIFVATPGEIIVEGDRATARSYTSEVYDQEGVTKRDRGVYNDELVKQDGRWLFSRRVFKNIHRA